ncbi:MAG: hypothetical protein ABI678_20930, partial [Kofleriaceae bacterium]
MSELAWFDGKVGSEFETARWVHDQNQQRIRDHDVIGLATQCAALFPAKGVFCGTLLAGFEGRKEVLNDALDELRTLIRTMPDDVCERVFAIVEKANLPIHLSKRREQYEASRTEHLASTIDQIRTRLATCTPTELVTETANLARKRRVPIFGLHLPPTAFEWAELAELGRARIRDILPTLPDDEALALMEAIRNNPIQVDTTAHSTEIYERRHRQSIARDAAGEPRNLELEATVDPDDPHGYAILGDFLQRSGHPRGELIALQLRSEVDPSIDVEAYIEAHLDALLGSLAHRRHTVGSSPRRVFTWRR